MASIASSPRLRHGLVLPPRTRQIRERMASLDLDLLSLTLSLLSWIRTLVNPCRSRDLRQRFDAGGQGPWLPGQAGLPSMELGRGGAPRGRREGKTPPVRR